MSVEARNEVDHDVNNGGSSAKNESRIGSETPVMDSAGAQQFRDAKPRLEGHIDEILLCVIAEALQRVDGSTPTTFLASVIRQALIKELRKYGAIEFMGLKGIDPSSAEAWLKSTNRVLQQLGCTPGECVTFAVSLLEEEAYLWWQTVTRHVSADRIDWEFFQSEFQKKYVGELYLEDRKHEFLTLKQGEMSVMDYEREFLRLSKYASELVPTEEESCKRFLQGLRDELKVQLVSHRMKEFVDLTERAKMVEHVLGLDKKSEFSRAIGKRAGTSSSYQTSKRAKETRESRRTTSKFSKLERARDCQPSVPVRSVRGPARDSDIPTCVHYGKKHRSECWKLKKACFRCGSLEHFSRDCLKNEDTSLVIAQRSIPSARGRGNPRSGFVSRGIQRKDTGSATQQSKVRAPAQAYVVRTYEEGDATDVIAGCLDSSIFAGSGRHRTHHTG
ncbi:uncharacterized protein [Gossypium hirsutum]|uniref:Uncharacterized protein isoform X1 n=1 Tax=Gossypium hirsutum TaxID=3635 RepID=A0ABM3C086_GOSHI|nr:uncharacterized protein LOC107955427 isoform X1 [Gossypium hirsutum]XP_040972722.1 uncharacterized protein LOC107955427 isoform X1 [Gossypium hirsutum]XP_040972724.1 uncharacterized protein LOC107955427 isoform X1 [Gossypium hirsutum]